MFFSITKFLGKLGGGTRPENYRRNRTESAMLSCGRPRRGAMTAVMKSAVRFSEQLCLKLRSHRLNKLTFSTRYAILT